MAGLRMCADVYVAAVMLCAGAVCARAEQTPKAVPAGSLAVVAEYDGIIHPIAVEFFDEVIDRSDLSGAAATVLVLRTPGGLLDSTRAIVSRMIVARAPVVVFVNPSGARAASAGFILVLAADVAAMTPGTHIGAAHPVSAAGGAEGETSEVMAKKVAADAAAFARTLAEARGRNAELAAAAVTESRAFTEREALTATPPLINLVAADLSDVFRQLDGRPITRFDGRTTVLDTANIAIERVEMTWRQRFLSAIAHPQIAYLLLTLGMLGLVVELWTPGAILPGVAGGLCLLLAFFAFQILPINTIGVLLIVFGIALLALELKVPSFGVLGIGGIAALLVGSVMVTREVPDVRVGYGLIAPVVLAVAGIFLFLGRLAVGSQRRRAVTGVEGLVGASAQALTPLGPGHIGQLSVRGEIWRGTSTTPIAVGQMARVRAVEGLTLLVEPFGDDAPKGASS